MTTALPDLLLPGFLGASAPAPAQPAGALVGRCRTLDQARAVVTFLDAASEKTLRSTVALTASRGRGKVGVCGRVACGRVGERDPKCAGLHGGVGFGDGGGYTYQPKLDQPRWKPSGCLDQS